MPYVKESDRTSAWYLFEPKFLCKVPQMATRTVEDLKEFGVFSTGDSVVDREMAKDWVSRWLSIAAMEDIFHRGYSVKVMNYNDTRTIYEHISKHLLVWREFFETMENNRVPPETIDELVRLDQFASKVYEPARHLFTHELVQSLFGMALQRNRMKNALVRGSFNKQTASPEVEAPKGPASLEELAKPVEKVSDRPDRFSLAKIFERQRDGGGSSWK